MAAKLTVSVNAQHRGYIALNTSTDVRSSIERAKKPNHSESFMVMREDAANSPAVLNSEYLAGPNQWPELPGFRDVIEASDAAFQQLANRLLDIAWSAINVDATEMSGHFSPPTTWLRLLHYPQRTGQADGSVFGSAPHTDFGCLTILAQDSTGGLQVRDQSGQWLDVVPDPGALIVNVGDMLQRWSNGIYRSTPHRVVGRSAERYSCAYFYDPHVSCTVAPLAACVSHESAPKYEPIVFGEFLREQLSASYDHHKEP